MNIDKATSNFLNNMKHQRDILKARETNASLIALRNKWRRQQDKMNYQSEYDRIRGLLESSVLKGTSTIHIKNRQKHLENMDIVGMRPSDRFDNLY
jgi:hypothetical protein